jgi:hypothetical protein
MVRQFILSEVAGWAGAKDQRLRMKSRLRFLADCDVMPGMHRGDHTTEESHTFVRCPRSLKSAGFE